MTKTLNLEDANSLPAREGETEDVVCYLFSDGRWVDTTVQAPTELELAIYVNQQELITILCSPNKLNHLVLGFLYGEGIISSINDVLIMRVCEEESVADVRINNSQFKLPTKRTLTSGCGGGAIFKTHAQRVDSNLVVSPMEVLLQMKELQDHMELYKISGGVHTSALSDTKKLLVVAEDIGRHNTLDKLNGECLMRGIETNDKLLLATGRISSEMLIKAARMQVPVVASRHSPTGRAAKLAHELGITLIGRVRGGQLRVYSHPARLGAQ